MELTRRDAAAALAALGAGGAVAVGLDRRGRGSDRADSSPEDRVRATLVAVAEVVYPTEVSGVETFVGTFVPARLDREDHGEALAATVRELDDAAREWYDAPVAELDRDARDDLLRAVGADTADEDPDGTLAERVRYYVVNELLLALYSSPTGGELLGLENPQGHPGGADSYQLPPDR